MHEPRRGTGLQILGLMPFFGAIAGVGWMLAVSEGSIGHQLLLRLRHPIAALLLVQTLFTLMLSLLWLRYRPFALPRKEQLPFLSVVIPAFNEGEMVERSIRSVVEADYPHDRLEVIVVDDGSRDDTYFHMQKLRREHKALVRLVRFRGNQGKRAALVAGFRAARGELVLTLDSDSEVEPQTLMAMVAPLVADPKVGGVAGKVAVLNRHTVLGRMLDVQYALAFDFNRAAQSVFRAVAVCPGALSCFRLAVILPHLDAWLDQRFLGRPVNHGEDQALTNIVLRAGYDTVYQSNAVVNTLTPERHRQLSRMLLRWDRSYIVEGFSFARFMFTRYREKNRLLPIVHFFLSNLRLVFFFWGILEIPSLFEQSPIGLFHAGVALAMAALFTAMYYLRVERSFRFVYGVLYAFYSLVLLQWILPWALVTVRDEKWGTR
jgi:hyaluronan synthase